MSTPTNDGGPAYPAISAPMGFSINQGMTLRDWIAGQAMAADITGYTHPASDLDYSKGGHAEAIASKTYILADVMIKERENRA